MLTYEKLVVDILYIIRQRKYLGLKGDTYDPIEDRIREALVNHARLATRYFVIITTVLAIIISQNYFVSSVLSPLVILFAFYITSIKPWCWVLGRAEWVVSGAREIVRRVRPAHGNITLRTILGLSIAMLMLAGGITIGAKSINSSKNKEQQAILETVASGLRWEMLNGDISIASAQCVSNNPGAFPGFTPALTTGTYDFSSIGDKVKQLQFTNGAPTKLQDFSWVLCPRKVKQTDLGFAPAFWLKAAKNGTTYQVEVRDASFSN